MFSDLGEPPYVAVIFSSARTLHDDQGHDDQGHDDQGHDDQGHDDQGHDDQGYDAMAERMDHLAAQQPGYVGIESARGDDGFGLTVSYWATEADARQWKQVAEHLAAQQTGRDRWYRRYIVRVATVQRQYDWPPPAP